jgi:hypothetical protein
VSRCLRLGWHCGALTSSVRSFGGTTTAASVSVSIAGVATSASIASITHASLVFNAPVGVGKSCVVTATVSAPRGSSVATCFSVYGTVAQIGGQASNTVLYDYGAPTITSISPSLGAT